MIRDVYHLYIAHRDSSLGIESFQKKYSDELSKVNIGCSFNPEHEVFESIKDPEQKSKMILSSAKFIVKELKIKEVRLSIRWNRVYDGEEINFAYYNELFRYFINKKVRICLNVGPIKTMRWPEDHIPIGVLEKLNEIPGLGKELQIEDELIQISLNYLKQLLKFLKKNFSKSDLRMISSIQANNEAFNRFGEHKWIISNTAECEFLKIIHAEFPNKKILLNSAGRNNMRRNLKLIKLSEIPIEKFILGYNYYYKVPGQAENFILKYFDNLSLTYPFSINPRSLKKLSSKIGFEIEVAELQAEPWLHITTPGNSAKEFKFAILRSVNSMLSLSKQKVSTIRYWGIEELCVKFLDNKLTSEHLEIIRLIKFLN